MTRWNPFRPNHSWLRDSWLRDLGCELMGIEGEAPDHWWGWLTQFGKCVLVTTACVVVMIGLCVCVCVLGGGR